jgi:hypothetical protein
VPARDTDFGQSLAYFAVTLAIADGIFNRFLALAHRFGQRNFSLDPPAFNHIFLVDMH